MQAMREMLILKKL